MKVSPIAVLFWVYMAVIYSDYQTIELSLNKIKGKIVVMTVVLIITLGSVTFYVSQFLSNYILGQAISLIQEKKWDRALRSSEDTMVFSDCIEYNADLRTHFYLGEIYYNTDKYGLAEKEFKEEIRLNPYFPDAKYNLGLVFKIQDKKDEAIAEFKKVLDLSSDFPEAIEKLNEYGVK
jgi:tetratricopeptide (TPR) repeat protein